MTGLPGFEDRDLLPRLLPLSREELDRLPFGVTVLGPGDVVRFSNLTECQQSGFGPRLREGRLFFTDIAPCLRGPAFRGRIEAARQSGKLDITFDFIGDFASAERELRVRVQAAPDGDIWIFIRR